MGSVSVVIIALVMWGLPRWASLYDLVLVHSLVMFRLEPNFGFNNGIRASGDYCTADVVRIRNVIIDRDLFNHRCMGDNRFNLIKFIYYKIVWRGMV